MLKENFPKVERESGPASNSDTWGAPCTWCWGRPTSPTLICFIKIRKVNIITMNCINIINRVTIVIRITINVKNFIVWHNFSFQVEENQKTKILIQVWNQNQAFVKCLRPVQFLIEQSDDISSPGRLLHPRSIFGFVATSTIPLLAPPTHHSPTVGQDDCLVRILRASLAPWQQVGRFEGHTFSFSHQLHPHYPLTGISPWWFSLLQVYHLDDFLPVQCVGGPSQGNFHHLPGKMTITMIYCQCWFCKNGYHAELLL